MTVLDLSIASEVFARVTALQKRFDHTQKPEKIAAKQAAAALLLSCLPRGGKMLDVGGEEFYQHFFRGFEITTHNLPLDMHEMAYRGEFDAAVAMHVLEHSPFPAYVLSLIQRSLRPGGWLYIAVPTPCEKFCTSYGHQAVMPAAMWRTLLEQAGFRVETQTSGKFGSRSRWIEDRFLCQSCEEGS